MVNAAADKTEAARADRAPAIADPLEVPAVADRSAGERTPMPGPELEPPSDAGVDLAAASPSPAPGPTWPEIERRQNGRHGAQGDGELARGAQATRTADAYGIPLPAWLRRCIDQGLPAPGSACPDDSDALLAAAFDFAFQLHDGQVRASGEPYIIHPVAVADLLRDIGASPGVIAAGFLHDVVEDTDVTPAEIEQHFGAEVRALVEGVTKLGGIHFTNRTEAQAENLRRMFLAMASDIRVVLVKLADRLHNMRTIGALKPEKQQRIARETREIYGPLANRLGIGRLKWELEDLAFKILEPEAFREIQQQVASKRSDREQRLGVTVQLLRDRLVAAGLANCEVSGRPKHLYGIWSKMERQQKAFHEIYDVAALRILTPNIEGCYRALAVVHDTFRPIPGRFKDYIGLPKPNGYQSLHTAVIGRHRPIEVQIRTAEMHQVAEYGIAAHWKYKEGGSPAASGRDAERFNWLRQLVDWQKDGVGEDSSDFLASIKEDLFDEEVFVFTPNGDVVGLRKGSTAVDFAYRIHSEIGNHCQGVRINDRLCPLATPLQNGDFVQVITAKTAHPSLDWLNFVATPTARNRIRHWYKRSHRDENILRGTAMLERELGRDGFDALLHGDAMARVARRCNLVSTEDLLASIGFGGVTLQQALNRLREEIRLVTAAAAPLPNGSKLPPWRRPSTATPVRSWAWRGWSIGWAAVAAPCPAKGLWAASPWATTASRSTAPTAPTWPRCPWSAACRCAGIPSPTMVAAAIRCSCALRCSIGSACSRTSSPASPTAASTSATPACAPPPANRPASTCASNWPALPNSPAQSTKSGRW